VLAAGWESPSYHACDHLQAHVVEAWRVRGAIVEEEPADERPTGALLTPWWALSRNPPLLARTGTVHLRAEKPSALPGLLARGCRRLTPASRRFSSW
jgi:hypothetical protein